MKNAKLLTLLLTIMLALAFFSFNGDSLYALANADAEDSQPEAAEPGVDRLYIYSFPIMKNGNTLLDPVGPIGGTFTSVLTDPSDSNVVIGGHYEAGVFISFNQGNTWYARNNGLPNLKIQSLAIHPRHSNILYAGTYGNGVYLSRDRGLNWVPWSGGMLENHIIYDIAIDPTSPSIVYTASRVDRSLMGYISRSTDAGKTWRVVYRGDWFDSLDYFYEVEVHPSGINTVYFSAHEHGFYRSVDNGQTFSAINAGVSDLSARGLAMNRANQNVILGGVWKGGGIYKSTNLGGSWQSSRTGLPDSAKITKIKADPNDAYGNRYFATTYTNGLYVSENSGGSWQNRGWNGSHINDIAISLYYPQTWFMATQYSGMVRTRDGGASWSTVMDDLRLYSVTGIQALGDDPDALYVSVYGMGVYRYVASENNWQAVNSGLASLEISVLHSYGKSLCAVAEDGLWRFDGDKWQSVILPLASAGNVDALKSWQASRLGEPFVEQAYRLAPQDNALENTGDLNHLQTTAFGSLGDLLYLGTDNGIWLNDAGKWTYLGLEGNVIYTIAIDEKTQSLWVSACGTQNKCQVFQHFEGEWFERGQGLNGAQINQLLFADDTLLAVGEMGVHRWDDANKAWKLVYQGSDGLLSITQNPNEPKQLLAGGNGIVVYSDDFGENWQEFYTELTWTYPVLAFSPGENVKFLLGSIESGPFSMEIDQ